MSSTKRLKYDGNCSAAAESLVQLPTDLIKNIFRFVGRGNYCFIGPVSKDFCYNYLTMDTAEDSYEHKVEFQLAVQRNKVTTATAASTSIELAEHSILNAPRTFQKYLCAKAALNGRLDILKMSDALGVVVEESIDEKVIVEVTKQGNLEVLKFLKEKDCEISREVVEKATYHGHLDILKWMHSHGLIYADVLFIEAARGGHLEIIEWGKDDIQLNFDYSIFAQFAAEGGQIELLKWFRSHGAAWHEDVFRCAAMSADISILQYLFENGSPVTNDSLAYVFPFTQDDDTKVFETFRLLHQMGVPWDEQVCMAAGSRGILDVVVYARANGCPWNSSTLSNAVVSGNFDIVKYCLENHCPIGDYLCCFDALQTPDHVVALKMLKLLRKFSVPWDEETCSAAAHSGNLEALKWARDQGCSWNEETFHNAIESEDIATIQYCINNGCPFDNEFYKDIMSQRKICFQILKLLQKNGHEWTEDACAAAAGFYRDIKVLRWLRYIGCPWDARVCDLAVQNNNYEMLVFAHENCCPWSKDTFAYCFEKDGLDGEYEEVPTKHTCRDKIFKYLKENKCPMPEANDWRLVVESDDSDSGSASGDSYVPPRVFRRVPRSFSH